MAKTNKTINALPKFSENLYSILNMDFIKSARRGRLGGRRAGWPGKPRSVTKK